MPFYEKTKLARASCAFGKKNTDRGFTSRSAVTVLERGVGRHSENKCKALAAAAAAVAARVTKVNPSGQPSSR